jgi:hypothetical protein
MKIVKSWLSWTNSFWKIKLYFLKVDLTSFYPILWGTASTLSLLITECLRLLIDSKIIYETLFWSQQKNRSRDSMELHASEAIRKKRCWSKDLPLPNYITGPTLHFTWKFLSWRLCFGEYSKTDILLNCHRYSFKTKLVLYFSAVSTVENSTFRSQTMLILHLFAAWLWLLPVSGYKFPLMYCVCYFLRF